MPLTLASSSLSFTTGDMLSFCYCSEEGAVFKRNCADPKEKGEVRVLLTRCSLEDLGSTIIQNEPDDWKPEHWRVVRLSSGVVQITAADGGPISVGEFQKVAQARVSGMATLRDGRLPELTANPLSTTARPALDVKATKIR